MNWQSKILALAVLFTLFGCTTQVPGRHASLNEPGGSRPAGTDHSSPGGDAGPPAGNVAVVILDDFAAWVSPGGKRVGGRVLFHPGEQKIDVIFDNGNFISPGPRVVSANLTPGRRYHLFFVTPMNSGIAWNPRLLDTTDDVSLMEIYHSSDVPDYRAKAARLIQNPGLLEQMAGDPSGSVRTAVVPRLASPRLLRVLAAEDLDQKVRAASQNRLLALSISTDSVSVDAQEAIGKLKAEGAWSLPD